jgi:hypothetical protein
MEITLTHRSRLSLNDFVHGISSFAVPQRYTSRTIIDFESKVVPILSSRSCRPVLVSRNPKLQVCSRIPKLDVTKVRLEENQLVFIGGTEVPDRHAESIDSESLSRRLFGRNHFSSEHGLSIPSTGAVDREGSSLDAPSIESSVTELRSHLHVLAESPP